MTNVNTPLFDNNTLRPIHADTRSKLIYNLRSIAANSTHKINERYSNDLTRLLICELHQKNFFARFVLIMLFCSNSLDFFKFYLCAFIL